MSDTGRRRRIEALFEAALDLPPEARADLLARECGEDAELRTEVEELLEAHESEGGVLDRGIDTTLLARAAREIAASGPGAERGRDAGSEPGPRADAEMGSADRPRAGAGTGPGATDAGGRRVGPYRLLSELGRGGMGVVYLAERADGQFQRRVALKLIRAGDDPDLHDRVVAERQILASLDHPNIARLLDGGVAEDGRPYLVMEHVGGLPIDVYCDRMRLSVAERLRLFATVCRAVDHAHRNLIVHRDLKPSNILVTPTGTVKLLDFGIAKLLNPALGGPAAPVTRTRVRALTPEYASPEQVRGETITTTSDVYALGVVLYLLLTGRHPYAAGESTAELVHAICHDDPERPSAVVRRAARRPEPEPDGLHGEMSPADMARVRAATPEDVAGARHTTPERLRRTLRGDLDAIVLRALRKEPARRYGSAELLAQDIERHLDGLPVLAHRGSRAYRLGKFARRHRLEGIAAAAVVVSLLTGTALATRSAGIARQERDRAEAALRQSEEVADFLFSLFEASDPEQVRGREVAARDLLRAGVARADQLAGEPLLQARMLGVLSRVHGSLGEYDEARRLAEQAASIHGERLGADHPEVALDLVRLADALERLGRYDSAQAVLTRAHAIQQAALGAESPEAAATLYRLADIAFRRAEFDRAERHAREALELRRRTLGATDPAAIESLAQLGSILGEVGDHDGAVDALREAVRLHEAGGTARSAGMAERLTQLADLLLFEFDDPRQAESLYRRALAVRQGLPDDEPEHTTRTLNGLARALEHQGDIAGAERTLREVVAIQRGIYGERHPAIIGSLAHLAGFHERTGRLEEAEALFRQMLDLVRETVGASHPMYAGTLTALARVLTGRDRLEEADTLLQRSVAIREALLGRDHPLVARTLRRRAEVQIRRRDFETAEALLHDALDIARARTSDQASAVRDIHATFVELYEAWGRPEDANRHRVAAGG